MALLTYEDLRDDLPGLSQAQIESRIQEAVSIAALYCPALTREDFPHKDAARAILRRAIIYDEENKDERTQTQQAGSYQITKFAGQRSGTLFSPSQIEALKALQPRPVLPQAFSVALEW